MVSCNMRTSKSKVSSGKVQKKKKETEGGDSPQLNMQKNFLTVDKLKRGA